ncbi:hypothetical protein HY991_03345, partial [Candidatus Micrarchaeota archaeon]|nr:hypothetical protein [Candidatus Micrarchaeota archaeon]
MGMRQESFKLIGIRKQGLWPKDEHGRDYLPITEVAERIRFPDKATTLMAHFGKGRYPNIRVKDVKGVKFIPPDAVGVLRRITKSKELLRRATYNCYEAGEAIGVSNVAVAGYIKKKGLPHVDIDGEKRVPKRVVRKIREGTWGKKGNIAALGAAIEEAKRHHVESGEAGRIRKIMGVLHSALEEVGRKEEEWPVYTEGTQELPEKPREKPVPKPKPPKPMLPQPRFEAIALPSGWKLPAKREEMKMLPPPRVSVQFKELLEKARSAREIFRKRELPAPEAEPSKKATAKPPAPPRLGREALVEMLGFAPARASVIINALKLLKTPEARQRLLDEIKRIDSMYEDQKGVGGETIDMFAQA